MTRREVSADPVALPRGYRVATDSLAALVDAALQRRDTAWDVYDIVGDVAQSRVTWTTNDNLDHGVPSEFASDEFVFDDQRRLGDAIAEALQFCGGTRFGIGHVVRVCVNGVTVEKSAS